MGGKKRQILFITIISFVFCVGIYFIYYQRPWLKEQRKSFIYQIDSYFPNFSGNNIRYEYLTEPNKEMTKKNYLYYSDNPNLFNGMNGNNYQIGFFSEIQDNQNSPDSILVLRDIKKTKKTYTYALRKKIPTNKEDVEVSFYTMIGKEKGKQFLRTAKNRMSIFEDFGFISSNRGKEELKSLQKNSLVIITYIPCDDSTQRKCIRNKDGNIYATGIYKRDMINHE